MEPSFIPPQPIRELRDLTRGRRRLVQDRAAVIQRIQKVLEDANIKLASVATDVVGKSGWAMLEALVARAQDPQKLAALAIGRLKAKRDLLHQALRGRVTDHHRFLLNFHMEQIRALDGFIATLDQRIDEQVQPFFQLIRRLDTVPGISDLSAKEISAEIGTDMDCFPDHDHLASWAGMCPGNNESAGKRKSGRTTKGNHWLRGTLGEAAWAAGRTKDTFLSSRYRRLASRRGKKRAIVAVGRSILVIVYHIIKDGATFKELGADFYERHRTHHLTRYHSKRLERLGYHVELKPAEPAA